MARDDFFDGDGEDDETELLRRLDGRRRARGGGTAMCSGVRRRSDGERVGQREDKRERGGRWRSYPCSQGTAAAAHAGARCSQPPAEAALGQVVMMCARSRCTGCETNRERERYPYLFVFFILVLQLYRFYTQVSFSTLLGIVKYSILYTLCQRSITVRARCRSSSSSLSICSCGPPFWSSDPPPLGMPPRRVGHRRSQSDTPFRFLQLVL